MRGEGDEEARNNRRRSEVFWMWRKWKGVKEGRFSVHHVGQERRCHGGTGAEGWNEQCLGPRREGLESLI